MTQILQSHKQIDAYLIIQLYFSYITQTAIEIITIPTSIQFLSSPDNNNLKVKNLLAARVHFTGNSEWRVTLSVE